MSTNQVIFQQINVNFSTFCRKFQYLDIIYSQNNGTSQQVEVQKRFRRILDMKKWNSWYEEMEFLISRNRFFFNIKKCVLFLDISRNVYYFLIYQETEFLISRDAIFISRIRFLDIKNSNFWYQEMEFLISRNIYYFLVSINRILDIKKSNSWYQKIFLDVKNSFLDIKKSNSWYQEIEFLISRNAE